MTAMAMVGEGNRTRRRTSTSVSPANGSLDLACDSDPSHSHLDRPQATKNSASSNSTQQQQPQQQQQQQPWLAVSTLFMLASLVLFAFYVGAGRWKGSRSQIGDFLAGKSDGPEGMPSLGIVLRPEDHRSRNASIITLHWTITSDFRAPDGVKKRVYLINGKFSAFHRSGNPSLFYQT